MGAPRHLYVHLPSAAPDPERALAAVLMELELRAETDGWANRLETIGVGPPGASDFGAGLGPVLRRGVGPERLDHLVEWTAEAFPANVDGALLAAWRQAGVTRVSLDVGSLRSRARAWMGRDDDVRGVWAALRATEGAGLATWGVDLLYGLPPEADPDPLESVRAVVEAGAPHLALYEWTGRDGADEDRRADQYLALTQWLEEAAGYSAYEMMAFALPGHTSRHALAMIRGEDCLGIGPGAHTRRGERRSWNLSGWEAYLTAVTGGHVPRSDGEVVGEEARRLETLWAGLRSRVGIAREGLGAASLALGDRWVREGLARPEPGRLSLTPEGWLRLDELAVELARTEGSRGEPPPGRGRSEGRGS